MKNPGYTPGVGDVHIWTWLTQDLKYKKYFTSSCPSCSRSFLVSNKLPSKANNETCESFNKDTVMASRGRQFSSTLSTLSLGHCASVTGRLGSWFLFRFSSTTCKSPTSGKERILLSDKSITSSIFSPHKSAGNDVNWLETSDRDLRFLKFENSPLGRAFRRHELTIKTSSFLAFPSSAGKVSEIKSRWKEDWLVAGKVYIQILFFLTHTPLPPPSSPQFFTLQVSPTEPVGTGPPQEKFTSSFTVMAFSN